jgi:predicted O-linked N-acetylglucosamine transferase (SPINDLY family)
MNDKPELHQPQGVADHAAEQANHALQDAQWAEKNGLPERAIAAYRKVIELFPGIFEVHNNLANLLLGIGRNDDAFAAAARAFELNPGDALVNANAGQALLRLGRQEEAIPYLHRALAARPELHPLRKTLAETLLELGRSDEAVAVISDEEERFADDTEWLAMVAGFCHRAKAGPPAEKCYLRLIELEPQRPAPYNDLAQLYIDFAQFSKAKDIVLRGLEVEPGSPVMWNTLANAQSCIGLVKEALASYRKVLALAPNLPAAWSNMLLTMHYTSDIPLAELVEAHREFGRLAAPPGLAQTTFANSPEPGRRLRLGYLSPDIRKHSVAFFLEPLLDNADRAGFELFCYADVKTPDEVTRRLRGKVDHFCNVRTLPDKDVIERVRADGIDILVDLAGHAGTTRAALLAHKLAPVQVTYCGYPDTTGMPAVDYRITDWLSDPAGVEGHYAERLVRLPDGFLCYLPPSDPPPVGEAPCLAGKAVTFGSFNREFKVSQETYDTWCRILHALPESRIVMKSIAGADPATREHQFGEFERRGIERSRVELVGFIPDQKQHLACYRDVDIALDTYPYHGTTTTLDSLLMGVPVITRVGYNHASRVGASLLAQVGLREFVAADADDYVARAVALAGDRERIAALRRTLRQRLLASPLCDGAGFARKFEYALRGMWCNWCRAQGSALSPAEAAAAAFDFGPVGDG